MGGIRLWWQVAFVLGGTRPWWQVAFEWGATVEAGDLWVGRDFSRADKVTRIAASASEGR